MIAFGSAADATDRCGRERGRSTITGAEIIAARAAEQFTHYTGVRLDDDQVRRAAESSRS